MRDAQQRAADQRRNPRARRHPSPDVPAPGQEALAAAPPGRVRLQAHATAARELLVVPVGRWPHVTRPSSRVPPRVSRSVSVLCAETGWVYGRHLLRGSRSWLNPVSYTHLTLPTIYSV